MIKNMFTFELPLCCSCSSFNAHAKVITHDIQEPTIAIDPIGFTLNIVKCSIYCVVVCIICMTS